MSDTLNLPNVPGVVDIPEHVAFAARTGREAYDLLADAHRAPFAAVIDAYGFEFFVKLAALDLAERTRFLMQAERVVAPLLDCSVILGDLKTAFPTGDPIAFIDPAALPEREYVGLIEGDSPALPTDMPTTLVRYGQQAMYSTTYLPAGDRLSNTQNKLFAAAWGAVGQGKATALDGNDTNLKHIGQRFMTADVYGIGWEIIGDPAIVEHGTLSWDFAQTMISIGPLTLRHVAPGTPPEVIPWLTENAPGVVYRGFYAYDQVPVALPAHVAFGVLLGFGSACPAPTVDTKVRVILFTKFSNHVEIG